MEGLCWQTGGLAVFRKGNVETSSLLSDKWELYLFLTKSLCEDNVVILHIVFTARECQVSILCVRVIL